MMTARFYRIPILFALPCVLFFAISSAAMADDALAPRVVAMVGDDKITFEMIKASEQIVNAKFFFRNNRHAAESAGDAAEIAEISSIEESKNLKRLIKSEVEDKLIAARKITATLDEAQALLDKQNAGLDYKNAAAGLHEQGVKLVMVADALDKMYADGSQEDTVYTTLPAGTIDKPSWHQMVNVYITPASRDKFRRDAIARRDATPESLATPTRVHLGMVRAAKLDALIDREIAAKDKQFAAYLADPNIALPNDTRDAYLDNARKLWWQRTYLTSRITILDVKYAPVLADLTGSQMGGDQP